jgi:hypothetical protein
MMPGNGEFSRRDDAVHRGPGAGVRIQYKNLCPTKKLGAIRYWICALSMAGKWPLRSLSTHTGAGRIRLLYCLGPSHSKHPMQCHVAATTRMGSPSRIIVDQTMCCLESCGE